VELTDEQVKNRKFSSYDEVFAKEAEGRVFNANRALELFRDLFQSRATVECASIIVL
jgi:hypothetical protein